MYHQIGSRVGQHSVAITIVRQLNAINKDATAYGVAKAMDCSQPTARKLLNECVALGLLQRNSQPYKNTIKYTYHDADVLSAKVHADNSLALIRYWSGENV